MPELPEVETLCRQLNEILPGEEILAVEVLDPLLGMTEGEGLAGRKIERVYRQGKYIRIEMGKGDQHPGISEPEKGRGKSKQRPPDDRLTAALHLRMTGRLFWQTDGAPAPPVYASGHLFCRRTADPDRSAEVRHFLRTAVRDCPGAGGESAGGTSAAPS